MTALAKKARRTNDPSGTRAKVLDAAVRLFQQNGYADTSMQDIMTSAGVSSGALHHHYATKKDLGLAVIRERVSAIVDEAWISPVANASGPERGVTRAFKDIIEGLTPGSIAGCPLNNLALELAYAEPEFRDEIKFIFEAWHAALRLQIARSDLLGPRSGLSSSDLATLVIASYSGAMTLAKATQSTKPLNTTLRVLKRFWKLLPSQEAQ